MLHDNNSIINFVKPVHNLVISVAGNEMANSGDYLKAIEFFSEAIKLDPTDCR